MSSNGKFFKIIFLFVLSILLGGCLETYSVLEPDIKKVDMRSKGIVVGTITNNKKGGATEFYFRNIKTGVIGRIGDSSGMYIGVGNNFRDRKDIRGSVFAIVLPAGKYEFYNWYLDNLTGMVISPRKPRKALFSVEEGKVSYVGNYHMEIETGKNIFGITITVGGFPSILDKANRDIPRIRKVYPMLSDTTIEKSVPVYVKTSLLK